MCLFFLILSYITKPSSMNLTLSGTMTDPFFLASPDQLHKHVGGDGSIQDNPLK